MSKSIAIKLGLTHRNSIVFAIIVIRSSIININTIIVIL